GEVVDAMEMSLKAFAALGAQLVDIRLPPHEVYVATAILISRPEGYAEHREILEKAPELFGAVTLDRLRTGAQVLAHEHIKARERQRELIAEVDSVLRDVDVFVLPSSRRPAQPLGYDALAGGEAFFNRPSNLTGHPALALCNGFTRSGLPLSLQI